LGVMIEHREPAAQGGAGGLRDPRVARLEPQRRGERGGDLGGHLVGAAVLVLPAVDGLRRVRAGVVGVVEAVAVVVGIRAAIGVLEAVLVLGLIRAAIGVA